MTDLVVGTTLQAQRTYSEEMVEAFTALSGDAGRHHVVRDDRGRLLVHGLLVASLATEIGGRLDYLARTLNFEFLRPVYSGDTITCTVKVDVADPDERRTRLELSGEATNQDGTVVMRITSTGIVRAR